MSTYHLSVYLPTYLLLVLFLWNTEWTPPLLPHQSCSVTLCLFQGYLSECPCYVSQSISSKRLYITVEWNSISAEEGSHTGLVLGQDWIPLIKKCRAAVTQPGKTKSMEMLVLLYSCTTVCLLLCCVQEPSAEEDPSLSSCKGNKAWGSRAQGLPSACALSSDQQLRSATPGLTEMRAAGCRTRVISNLEWHNGFLIQMKKSMGVGRHECEASGHY